MHGKNDKLELYNIVKYIFFHLILILQKLEPAIMFQFAWQRIQHYGNFNGYKKGCYSKKLITKFKNFKGSKQVVSNWFFFLRTNVNFTSTENCLYGCHGDQK